MTSELILVSQAEGIATIALNRPEKRNAIHGPLINQLSAALNELAANDSRVVIITSSGDHFCAGGDIAWMQKMATGPEDENYDDAQLLADLLYQLYTFPKPTIVLAQGATMGGGLGLLAAADIAIATKNASFGLPEVKIGLTPSMISPYVIAAIGERAAYYYFLTGERFDAVMAHKMGLIHQIADADDLMNVGMTLALNLMQNSPGALVAAKKLIRYVAKEKITESLSQKTAQHLAELRRTPEAQEGLNAFVAKRKAKWVMS